MSRRLQVILDDQEFAELQSAAKAHGTTVSEWVRQSLRNARRAEPSGDLDTKLAALRAAARHSFPTSDIDGMLAEIERGYSA